MTHQLARTTRRGFQRTLRRLTITGFSVAVLGSCGLAQAQHAPHAPLSGAARTAAPRPGEIRRSADGLALYQWNGRGWVALHQTGRVRIAGATRLSDAEAAARLQSLVRQLQQATAAAQTSGLKPGQIAPGVRENIPVNPALRTPQERRWIDASNADAINRLGGMARQATCEAALTSYPYDVNGNLATGWYGTVLGPQRSSCMR